MPPEELAASRTFWDAKAREQPYWYVSSFTDYGRPDLEEFWRSGRDIWDQLKARAGYVPSPGHAVLEIGCGVGRLSAAIAPEVGTLVSVDLSPRMLALARQRHPHLRFELIDGASLAAYPDGAFDLVVAYCVWQHLPSRRVLARCLAESRRVLAPAGRLIFTYAARTPATLLLPLARARAAVREWRAPAGPRGLYRREWVGIRLGAGQTERLCRRAGLAVVTHDWLHQRDKRLVVAVRS